MIQSKLATASINSEERKLTIHWSDGKSSAFHYVWLRHSGRCPQGMLNDISIKIDLLPDDPKTLKIERFEIKDDALSIQWADDGLETIHELSTLRRQGYDASYRRQRKPLPCLWDAHNASDIPVFDYSALTDTIAVLHIQCAVRDYGIARLTSVPVDPGTIAQVAECFGPIHVNNYRRIFDVQTETNVAMGSNTGAYLVLYQGDIGGCRAHPIGQSKVPPAGNGQPLRRAVTPYWPIG